MIMSRDASNSDANSGSARSLPPVFTSNQVLEHPLRIHPIGYSSSGPRALGPRQWSARRSPQQLLSATPRQRAEQPPTEPCPPG
jgi:hypothetical protein